MLGSLEADGRKLKRRDRESIWHIPALMVPEELEQLVGAGWVKSLVDEPVGDLMRT